MARSRSSFEITGAIAAAAALAHDPEPRKESPRFGGVPLVSFGAAEQPPPSAPPSEAAALAGMHSDLPPSSTTEMGSEPGLSSALPLSGPDGAPASPTEADGAPASRLPSTAAPAETEAATGAHADARRPPPGLPDLTGVMSPVLRCEKVVAWIVEATGASDVFLADSSGLAVAGATREEEAKLAAAGWIASAAGALAEALPGAPSPLFELHLGEGPCFQLINFQVQTRTYIIGLARATPLTPRQAHAIRAACRHALADALGGPE
jgi:hypothetical protein